MGGARIAGTVAARIWAVPALQVPRVGETLHGRRARIAGAPARWRVEQQPLGRRGIGAVAVGMVAAGMAAGGGLGR